MPGKRTRLGPEDMAFFVELGARIATLRKARGLTQAQLAEAIGRAQPDIAQFERGKRRIPVSELTLMAQALDLSLDELVGNRPKSSKRGPVPLLQRQLERLYKLPRPQQRVISAMLEAYLDRAAS